MRNVYDQIVTKNEDYRKKNSVKKKQNVRRWKEIVKRYIQKWHTCIGSKAWRNQYNSFWKSLLINLFLSTPIILEYWTDLMISNNDNIMFILQYFLKIKDIIYTMYNTLKLYFYQGKNLIIDSNQFKALLFFVIFYFG